MSKWTPNPSTERASLRNRQKARRRRFLIWTFGIVAIGSFPLTCFAPVAFWHATSWMGIASALAIASTLGWIASLTQRDDAQRERIVALRAEFGAVNGWLVDVAIVQGDAPTGRDVGLAWFEDGRLMFLGERTSFGLAAHSIEGPLENVGPTPGLRHPVRLPLRLRTAAGQVSVGFDFLPSAAASNPLAIGDRTFENEVRTLLGAAEPSEGSLPPLALGPGAPTPSWLMAQALASAAAWPLGALAVVSALAVGGETFAAFVGAGLTGALVAWPAGRSPGLVWRAWRDRRRLEAFEARLEGEAA